MRQNPTQKGPEKEQWEISQSEGAVAQLDSEEKSALTPTLCEICKTGWTVLEIGEFNKVPFCIPVKVLNTKGKLNKENRESKRDEMLKLVAALRNSGGGSLIVHFRELKAEHRNLCYFHESFDDHLNNLIEDGKLFADVYKKIWYREMFDENDPLSEYLILTVAPSKAISTADFKTKIALDFSVLRPSAVNMKHLLSDENKLRSPLKPILRFSDYIEESRCVQFKSVSSEFMDMTLNEKADYVWVNLRLREYITSFTKLSEGGSFFIGIAEKPTSDPTGFRKVEIIKLGIPLLPGDRNEFEECLQHKIDNSMLFQFDRDANIPLVNFRYHQISDGNCVVEIAVRSVYGCVFYDTQGPETYCMEDGEKFKRVPFKIWLEKLKGLTF